MADNKDPSEPEKSPTSIKRNPSETTMEESCEEPTTRVQPLSRETPVRQASKTPPKSPRITVRIPKVVFHLSKEESSKEPKKKSPTIMKRNSGSLTMEESPKEPKKKKTVHNPDFNAGDDDDDDDDDDSCISI